MRELQYVEAARALGSSDTRIMSRHILPNVAAPIIVIASIQIGNAILAEAALSFLSLGIATAASPSWGKMLQDTYGLNPRLLPNALHESYGTPKPKLVRVAGAGHFAVIDPVNGRHTATYSQASSVE